MQTRVSIVVPVYYNQASLPVLHQRFKEISSRVPQSEFEFIFVDDGSEDNSFDVLKELAKQDARIKALRLVRNFGSNAAVMAGLSHATGDCAVVISADLQDPPELIPEMISKWQNGAWVVLAVRAQRHDPLASRLLSNLFNWLFRKFVFSNFPPHGFDFALMDRRVVNVLTHAVERNSYLAGLLLWTGFHYVTVSYVRAKRPIGKSKWNLSKRIKYFLDAFVGFSYLPLRLASFTGIALAVSGFVYAVGVIIAGVIGRYPVEGWASLMVALLLISGTQLAMFGILGEYVWRNLDETRHRPLFLIDETIGTDGDSARMKKNNRLDPDSVLGE